MEDRGVRRQSREIPGKERWISAGPVLSRGMEQASGKYVVFADADDYFGPELLKNLYEAVSGEEADLGIGGDTAVFPHQAEKRSSRALYNRQSS